MIASPPPYYFGNSSAVAVLFLVSAVAPILIVAGMRGRFGVCYVSTGVALLAVILGFSAPELFRLSKFMGASEHWIGWCSFLFAQSLLLSLFGIKRKHPEAIDGTPIPPDDGSERSASDSVRQ